MEEVRLEVAVKLRQCIEQLGGKSGGSVFRSSRRERTLPRWKRIRGEKMMGGDGDEWDDDWDARRWLFGMLGMACSERFGIFFQHSFGELKLDEIGRPGRGGGQKLNEVE